MIDFNPSFKTEGTFAPDRLMAGDHPVRTRGVTVAAGQNLPRGALLGRIDATGKYILSLAAAGDGSQAPLVILGENVDATAGDVVSFAYEAGDFNSNRVTFGAGHTAASVRDALVARSIYLHQAVAA